MAKAQGKAKVVGKKAAPTGFRPTPALRSALEMASKKNGRSLSQEIESRLEGSFYADSEYGSTQQRAFFRTLAAVAVIIEERTGKSWIKDVWTAVAVSKAWRELIQEFHPKLDADRELEPILADLPTKPQAPDIKGPKRPPYGLLTRATPEEMSDYERRADEHFQAWEIFAVEAAEFQRKLADREEQLLQYAKDLAEHANEFSELGSEAARSIFSISEQERK